MMVTPCTELFDCSLFFKLKWALDALPPSFHVILVAVSSVIKAQFVACLKFEYQYYVLTIHESSLMLYVLVILVVIPSRCITMGKYFLLTSTSMKSNSETNYLAYLLSSAPTPSRTPLPTVLRSRPSPWWTRRRTSWWRSRRWRCCTAGSSASSQTRRSTSTRSSSSGKEGRTADDFRSNMSSPPVLRRTACTFCLRSL